MGVWIIMSKLIWRQRINKALDREDKGIYPLFDLQERSLAVKWHACAVDELFGPIPEMDIDTQEDYIEMKCTRKVLCLGGDFADAIKEDNPRVADRIYTALEKIKFEIN